MRKWIGAALFLTSAAAANAHPATANVLRGIRASRRVRNSCFRRISTRAGAASNLVESRNSSKSAFTSRHDSKSALQRAQPST